MEGAGADAGFDDGPVAEGGERADDGAVADQRAACDDLLERRPFADAAVDQPAARPDLDARAITVRPCSSAPGKIVTSRPITTLAST